MAQWTINRIILLLNFIQMCKCCAIQEIKIKSVLTKIKKKKFEGLAEAVQSAVQEILQTQTYDSIVFILL